MVSKIYYNWYISFICERSEKFLIFSINFVIRYDFSLIEIYGILGVRSKEIWMTKTSYSLVCIWSSSSIFGLNCILRYIISHIYHLSLSETRTFWFSALISSSYVTLHQFRYMGYWVWEAKQQVWVKITVFSFVYWVRGWRLAWIAS